MLIFTRSNKKNWIKTENNRNGKIKKEKNEEEEEEITWKTGDYPQE